MVGADTGVVVVAAMACVVAIEAGMAMAADFEVPATIARWADTAVVALAAIALSVDFEAAVAEARAVALAVTAASAAATAVSAAAMGADVADHPGLPRLRTRGLLSSAPL
jgi:hypothetical protein